MAKSLTFDTGVVEYEINGAATVRFNPTDTVFVERMYRTFTDLDERQGEFQKKVDEIDGDGEEMFAYAKERDAEMRGIIDDLLGEGVADALAEAGNFEVTPEAASQIRMVLPALKQSFATWGDAPSGEVLQQQVMGTFMRLGPFAL